MTALVASLGFHSDGRIDQRWSRGSTTSGNGRHRWTCVLTLVVLPLLYEIFERFRNSGDEAKIYA